MTPKNLSRRAALAGPLALAIPARTLASSAVPPDVAAAVAAYDAARRRWAEADAAYEAFDAAHPGPLDGGTPENGRACFDLYEATVEPLIRAALDAMERMYDAIQGHGALAAFVGGRLIVDTRFVGGRRDVTDPRDGCQVALVLSPSDVLGWPA